MIVSFPLGAYAIFNSDIGDDIDYTYPLEKFDIFIAGVNLQIPLEYQIGDLFIIFWSIFVILFVISFLGPKKNFMKMIGNILSKLLRSPWRDLQNKRELDKAKTLHPA